MTVGIIGGSGVYDMDGIEGAERRRLSTPFGDPSDEYVCGKLDGVQTCFLPRHGRGHRILPSEINHRANIFGMKVLGVERVLSVSAVGSLKEEISPRDIVLPDQYFDRTKRPAEHTFFGKGIVAHIAFADPACAALRGVVEEAGRRVIDSLPECADIRIHPKGTYVNMEGPAFSTRAESHVYRKLGFDIIGMTSLAEAKLCREAEICYQAIAMVTDYDCWHESEEPVTVEVVIGHLKANSTLAGRVVRTVVGRIPGERDCDCADALRNAMLTAPDAVPPETRAALQPIVGKYFGQ
ncbi:S-methyl-5'-thioadenosine phosphorylase [Verrucomicrobiota bacterium]